MTNLEVENEIERLIEENKVLNVVYYFMMRNDRVPYKALGDPEKGKLFIKNLMSEFNVSEQIQIFTEDDFTVDDFKAIKYKILERIRLNSLTYTKYQWELNKLKKK